MAAPTQLLTNPLTTVRLDQEEYQALKEELDEWLPKARAGYDKCIKTKQDPFLFHYSERSIGDIITTLNSPMQGHEFMYVCSDANSSKIQAVALVQIESITRNLILATLVTHPHNLRHSLNNSVTQIHGTAACIMHFLFQEVLTYDLAGIELSSYEYVKPLYEKYGFKEDLEKKPGLTTLFCMYIQKKEIEKRYEISSPTEIPRIAHEFFLKAHSVFPFPQSK